MNDDELIVRASQAILCSDLHVPKVSMSWMDRLIRYGGSHGTKTLIVAGDVWDFPQFTSFDKTEKTDLASEIEKGKALLHRLSKTFTRIYAVCGNHDRRIGRAMNDELTYVQWMKSINANIVVTNNAWLTLVSGSREFLVGHADAFSPMPGKIATNLSHIKAKSVAIGHGHGASVTFSPNGKHVAVDLGCMAQPDLFDYKTQKVNTYPDWINAFALVKDGRVRLITDATF